VAASVVAGALNARSIGARIQTRLLDEESHGSAPRTAGDEATTGGKHATHSYHYLGRAADVAGSAGAMRQFYREMSHTNPTELFYDPMGGMKHGRNIGAIGGHGDHVHVAY